MMHLVSGVLRQRVPGQLVIQLTDRCNARCPQCGMRVTEDFPRTRLETDRVLRLIDAAVRRKITSLSFTGGEPLIYLKDLAPLIRYAVDAGIPYVRTGTNGFLFMGSESEGFESRMESLAETLARSGVRNFWISIDSADPAVHETMRGLPGVIAGIRKALPIFHRHGLFPSANLGINRNITQETMALLPDCDGEAFYQAYRNGFRAFYNAVVDMGFTIVNSCYPMSVSPDDDLAAVYSASSTDRVVCFSNAEKALLYTALFDTIPEFRRRIRIFSPRTSLYALIKETMQNENHGMTSYPCRGGIDFFFIDAKTGHTYPCGFRGQDDYGPFDASGFPGASHERPCRECHWECFRDPSELAGPLLDLARRPHRVFSKFLTDRLYARLWFEDLTYYRACGWFDGRKPMA